MLLTRTGNLMTLSALATVLAAAPVAATTFNLRVSYYGSYDSAMQNKEAIEANFRHMAEGIYESTNGVHTLGKVTVYTDAAYNDNAAVVWVNECWPNAHINGLGSAGQRIEHCDIFPNGGNPMSFLEKRRSGGYTLMHEWGHFAYALYDEYQNDNTACGADPGSPCKDDVGVANSVMNSHWGAIGENDSMGDLNWLNFSTPLNNGDSGKNANRRIYNASSWEILARPDAQDPTPGRRKQYEDLLNARPAEGQVPSVELKNADGSENQDALQKALANVSFEWVAGANVAAAANVAVAGPIRAGERAGAPNAIALARVIIIDNSRAVSPQMLAEIKAAAQALVDSAEEGEQVAVLTLDRANPIIAGLTTLRDEAARDSVIQAIGAITPGNRATLSPAQLLDVLVKGLGGYITQLKGITSSLYIFANGHHAKDMLTDNVVKALSNMADMMLYVFDTGTDGAAAGALRKAVAQTEGMYLAADTPDKLDMALEQAELDATPGVDVVLASHEALIGSSQEFPFTVDRSLSEIEISTQYTGRADAVRFSLVDPKGAVTEFTAEDCGDVAKEAVEGGEQKNYCFTQLSGAMPGDWKIIANGAALVRIHVSAYPNENGNALFSTVNTRFERGSLLIEASVSGDEKSMTGIRAVATITKPDGTHTEIALNDAGTAPDDKARDGVYSGALANAAEGDYLVTVRFDNTSGTGQLTDASAAFAPSTTGKLPSPTYIPAPDNFTRVAQTQATVQAMYKRVMNWGEATYPELLPMRGKQEMDVPVDGVTYKVRFYPQANTYLGYNPANGRLYFYNANAPRDGIIDLEPLMKFATLSAKAVAAGF